MRNKIRQVFNCEIYDNYGLNDGGVSAFECSEHCGLHIDTERGIMEIVSEDGTQIERGEGHILATSLFNYALPFIRYDTGDIGYLLDSVCSCGRKYKLLREIIGRTMDLLITPEGKVIHGNFFDDIIMIENIREYQIVQESLEKVIIKLVSGDGFDDNCLLKIEEIIKKRSSGWQIEFRLLDKIERTKAGKSKIIINNLTNNNIYNLLFQDVNI
ncbi:MAG: hypothetical protein MUO26_11830 [Methanotrichaceae archaeon]|nr:hypothetical protein [Methanotrichaceae archaeon]